MFVKRRATEMVLVYDADGTHIGEVKYALKKMLGLGHCSACDITHGPRVEKPEFTRLKRAWGVPLRNIHRDEMDAVEAKALRKHVPCVAARTEDGHMVLLLDAPRLDRCAGDVDAFRQALDDAIARERLLMPPARAGVCGLRPPPNVGDADAVVPAS